MADLTPLTSVFTQAGLVLAVGTKITIETLNKIVDNTGFNWLGGRHPMVEAFGITEIPFTPSDEVEEGELYPPIDFEVEISTRHSGVNQFTKSDSYNVFLSSKYSLSAIAYLNSDYTESQDSEDENIQTDISQAYGKLISTDVAEKTPTSFTIRLNFPKPTPTLVPTTFSVGWFAKGW